MTNVHEPTAIAIPKITNVNATHCGFRDRRYNPTATGCFIGVFRKLINPTTIKTTPAEYKIIPAIKTFTPIFSGVKKISTKQIKAVTLAKVDIILADRFQSV